MPRQVIAKSRSYGRRVMASRTASAQRLRPADGMPTLRTDGFYDDALSAAGIGAWQCDLSTSALTWTPGVFEIFGIPSDARLDRRDIVGLYAEESRQKMERLRAEAIRLQQGFSMDAQIIRPDGQIRWMRLSATTLCSNGRPVLLRGTKQDVTEERHRFDRLRRRAEEDPLTGVSSRRAFQDRFLENAGPGAEIGPVGALVLFDVDGFKQVNDRWGHGGGDACLRTLAARLIAGFPDAVMIARIGGDEFAVLIGAPVSLTVLDRRLRAQVEALRAPFRWRSDVLEFSASAGSAVTADLFSYDAEGLFVAADAALYSAKRAGRNTSRVTLLSGTEEQMQQTRHTG